MIGVRTARLLGGAVLFLSVAIGAGAARAQEPVTLKMPIFTAATSTVMIEYITAKGIDKKHGIALDTSRRYESLMTLYQDFFQGAHDIMVATWDTLAIRHAAGAPVHMVASFTRANIAGIVVRTDSGISTVQDLKGKTFAVPTGSGMARMTQAFFKKFYGLEFARDVSIMNVPGGTQGPTYVGAKRADAALSWEPAISVAMHRAKNMRVLTTMDRMFKENTGHDFFYLVIAMQAAKLKSHPGIVDKVVAMFRDAEQQFTARPEEALAVVARTLEVEKDAMLEGIKTKRLTFDIRSANDPEVSKAMRYQMDFMTEHGVFERKIPAEFLFAGR